MNAKKPKEGDIECTTQWFISVSIALQLSLHIAESHSLTTCHQIALEIVRIGPWRIGIVIFIVRLDLLQFFLLLVIHAHQLYPGLFINCWFSNGSTWPSLGQLHDYLRLFILASVWIKQLVPQQLLACPPHRWVFGVQVLNRTKPYIDLVGVHIFPNVLAFMNGTRRLPFAQSFKIRISDNESSLELLPNFSQHWVSDWLLLILRTSFSSTIL